MLALKKVPTYNVEVEHIRIWSLIYANNSIISVYYKFLMPLPTLFARSAIYY